MTTNHGGGDHKSRRFIAARANLVTEIDARRQQLDAYIAQLRQVHGDAAVDQALALLRQRERINVHQPRSSGRL